MNTKLKRIFVGLTLLFSMGTANALEILVINPPYNKNYSFIDDLSAYGVNGYSNTVTRQGLFSDRYDFTIPSLSGVSGLDFSLWDTTSGISQLSFALMSGSTILDQGTSSLFFPDITQGNYFFVITGNADGINGGQYSISAVAAPIPEPSTWAMLLGGLGLFGFMARNGKHNIVA